jgi:hypothetical protein
MENHSDLFDAPCAKPYCGLGAVPSVENTIPMGHQQRDLAQYMMKISEIQHDTSISFFPDLAEPIRSQIENMKPAGLW